MDKRQLMLAGCVLALAMGMTSCVTKCDGLSFPPGELTTEVRPLTGFETIMISGSPSVYYTQADSFSVVVKGPEHVVADILTDVNDKQLVVRNRGKIGVLNFSRFDDEEVGVYVTSPDLTSIQLNGSGDFEAKQRVDTDNMTIVLRGSGDIDFKDIICDHCTTELVGSGDIEIGRLDSHTSTVSLIGSGDIKLKQWNVRETEVTLRGSGDIALDFVEGCRTADCQLTGSGDITLRGHIGQYKGQKRGSGEIDTQKLSIEK